MFLESADPSFNAVKNGFILLRVGLFILKMERLVVQKAAVGILSEKELIDDVDDYRTASPILWQRTVFDFFFAGAVPDIFKSSFDRIKDFRFSAAPSVNCLLYVANAKERAERLAVVSCED